VFESAYALSFASCHLEGEEKRVKLLSLTCKNSVLIVVILSTGNSGSERKGRGGP